MDGRIAVIDPFNMDIGLKILMGDACDYIILESEFSRDEAYSRRGILPIYGWDSVTQYRCVFIIFPLLHLAVDGGHFCQRRLDAWNIILGWFVDGILLDGGVCVIVDNYDYHYCPVLDLGGGVEFPKGEFDIRFLKRNMRVGHKYAENVFPFPYIIFGYQSVIDIVLGGYYVDRCECANTNKLCFFGSYIDGHSDVQYGSHCDRLTLICGIMAEFGDQFVCAPWVGEFRAYLAELSRYKYCLDLLGCGEPNKRTFEIVGLRGSGLMLSQRGGVVWPEFGAFSPETYFSDVVELRIIVDRFENDHGLYLRCLENQENIRREYMSRDGLLRVLMPFISP